MTTPLEAAAQIIAEEMIKNEGFQKNISARIVADLRRDLHDLKKELISKAKADIEARLVEVKEALLHDTKQALTGWYLKHIDAHQFEGIKDKIKTMVDQTDEQMFRGFIQAATQNLVIDRLRNKTFSVVVDVAQAFEDKKDDYYHSRESD